MIYFKIWKNSIIRMIIIYNIKININNNILKLI